MALHSDSLRAPKVTSVLGKDAITPFIWHFLSRTGILQLSLEVGWRNLVTLKVEAQSDFWFFCSEKEGQVLHTCQLHEQAGYWILPLFSFKCEADFTQESYICNSINAKLKIKRSGVILNTSIVTTCLPLLVYMLLSLQRHAGEKNISVKRTQLNPIQKCHHKSHIRWLAGTQC